MNPIHYESISVTWANIILLISLLPIKKKTMRELLKSSILHQSDLKCSQKTLLKCFQKLWLVSEKFESRITHELHKNISLP